MSSLSFDVSHLTDNSMQAFEVGEQKLLLTKVGGQIYATASKCPHYGAPLEKGVLTPEGRLTCQWHGACINVKTGDIEDGPTFDCLKTFKVKMNGSHAEVAVTEADLKENQEPPRNKALGQEKSNEVTVIVGGGGAGSAAADSLRENGFTGKVIVIGREPHLGIDRTKLSKATTTDAAKLQIRTKKYYDEREIEFQTGVQVTKLDKAAQKLHLDNGSALEYTKLILAPGSFAKTIPLENSHLKGIHCLRSIEHLEGILGAVKSKGDNPSVLIIGTGFIGMELAAVMAKQMKAKVTVVSSEKVPMAKVLGEEVGNFLKRFHESFGTVFHMSAKIAKFIPSESDSSRVGGIQLQGSGPIRSDIVLVGAGAGLATDFLKESGLPLNKDGSLTVDSSMKVIGTQNIWAAGDVARFPVVPKGHPAGDENGLTRVEHWNVAINTGRTAGFNAARAGDATPVQAYDKVPYFWSAQFGKSIRYCGSPPYDDIYVKSDGDLNTIKCDDAKFVAWYGNKGNVVAVASLMKDPIVSKVSELLRKGHQLKMDDIRSGTDVLSIPFKNQL